MDTLLKLGVVGGGIALLKIFGDDMVPYLASLLKSIKEGKIGEYLREAYEYVKDIGVGAFELIKEKTILLIDAFVKVKDFVVDTYNKINAFVMSYDEDEDGKLDPDEIKKLRSKIIKETKQFLMDLVGTSLLAVGSIFGGIKVAGILTAFNAAPLAAGATKGALGAGVIGTAAIAALVGVGLYKAYSNTTNALNLAIDEETGLIDKKKFAGMLVAGTANPEGGIEQGAINAFDKGLIGLSVGAIIGFMIGGPAGAIVGARIGAMAGTVIGAIAGYVGSDEMGETMSNVGTNFGDGMDVITSALTGTSTNYDRDIERLNDDLTATQSALEIAENATYRDEKKIADLKKLEAKLLRKIENAPALIQEQSGYDLDSINKEIKANTKRLNEKMNITNAFDTADPNDLYPGDDKHYHNLVKSYPKGELGSDAFKKDFGFGLKYVYHLPFAEQKLYLTAQNIKLNKMKKELENKIDIGTGYSFLQTGPITSPVQEFLSEDKKKENAFILEKQNRELGLNNFNIKAGETINSNNITEGDVYAGSHMPQNPNFSAMLAYNKQKMGGPPGTY